MPPPDIPGRKPATNSRDDTSPHPPASEDLQLSGSDGVSTNVSSVAMDRGLMGGSLLSGGPLSDGLPNGSRPFSGLPEVANFAEAFTDADIMLRVKTGDESAFAYLVQKYRRPMVGFMFRFCRNPSAPAEVA